MNILPEKEIIEHAHRSKPCTVVVPGIAPQTDIAGYTLYTRKGPMLPFSQKARHAKLNSTIVRKPDALDWMV